MGGESRRISFAEPQRPQGRRYYIPTKGPSLASGFPYIKKLNRWGVMEAEWSDFSDAVVLAANIPGPKWAWFYRKNEVIKRIGRDLRYESDFKTVLKRWNRHFKRKGFQAYLELPQGKHDPPRKEHVNTADPDDSSDDEEEIVKKVEKKYPNRFRMIVSSNVEKGSSVYSRTSSLTRSITGEGANMQAKAAQKAHEKATEHAAEQEDQEDDDGGNNTSAQQNGKVELTNGDEQEVERGRQAGGDAATGVGG